MSPKNYLGTSKTSQNMSWTFQTILKFTKIDLPKIFQDVHEILDVSETCVRLLHCSSISTLFENFQKMF